MERFTSSSLREVGQWWEGEGKDDSRSCLKLKGNIESPIGLVKVPLAVAGPLLVRGKHMNGYALVPCVTTEGALVASITRGAAALTRAGGVHTLASEQRQIRAPSFVTRNAAESEQLWQWLQSHAKELQEQVRTRTGARPARQSPAVPRPGPWDPGTRLVRARKGKVRQVRVFSRVYVHSTCMYIHVYTFVVSY